MPVLTIVPFRTPLGKSRPSRSKQALPWQARRSSFARSGNGSPDRVRECFPLFHPPNVLEINLVSGSGHAPIAGFGAPHAYSKDQARAKFSLR
jgi:hypothetical protein